MQELAPSRGELDPLINTLGEAAKGAGQGANQLRQQVFRGANEKPQQLTTRDPLTLYIEAIRNGVEIPFEQFRQILEGATSYLGSRYNEGEKRTTPLAMPKKKTPNRNFSLQD